MTTQNLLIALTICVVLLFCITLYLLVTINRYFNQNSDIKAPMSTTTNAPNDLSDAHIKAAIIAAITACYSQEQALSGTAPEFIVKRIKRLN